MKIETLIDHTGIADPLAHNKAQHSPETRKKVVFDYDPEPDLSWLDQDEFRQENKANHIALEMLVFEMTENDNDWRLIDSLGNIDCLADKNDWATGTFYNSDSIPEGYLRQLAVERFAQ